jgi:hypothetical protein
VSHVERLQGLLGSVAFPETPEERDEAEKAIMAFSDSVGELLTVKRITYDKKLDEFRAIEKNPEKTDPSDIIALFTNQGEMQEISTTILQLEHVLGMERDVNRPFGFKMYMEYAAKKEGKP